MGAKTDFLENKQIDHRLRGQVYTPPATVYVALFTIAPTDAGGGTEVSGGSYARVAVAASLAEWAGTQGAGTTTASTGTGGTTSNNNDIVFPAPTASWGQAVAFGVFDAPTGGNLTDYASLTAPKTINNGDSAPKFPAGSLTIQEDN